MTWLHTLTRIPKYERFYAKKCPKGKQVPCDHASAAPDQSFTPCQSWQEAAYVVIFCLSLLLCRRLPCRQKTGKIHTLKHCCWLLLLSNVVVLVSVDSLALASNVRRWSVEWDSEGPSKNFRRSSQIIKQHRSRLQQKDAVDLITSMATTVWAKGQDSTKRHHCRCWVHWSKVKSKQEFGVFKS